MVVDINEDPRMDSCLRGNDTRLCVIRQAAWNIHILRHFFLNKKLPTLNMPGSIPNSVQLDAYGYYRKKAKRDCAE